jgi:thiol-disulfide isomerase/thioredoxin
VNPVGDDEPKPPAPPAGEPAAAPEEPPEEPEEPVAAQNPPGEVIVLSDDTFNAVAKQYEIVLVNFYADWCRFSQMLKPIYAASAKEMGEMNQVRLGSINCEADDTVATREGNHISKYPTIKVFRRGVALKSEYRGYGILGFDRACNDFVVVKHALLSYFCWRQASMHVRHRMPLECLLRLPASS